MDAPLDLLVTAAFDYRINFDSGELIPWLSTPKHMNAVADVIAAMPVFADIAFGGRAAMKPCPATAESARAIAGVGHEVVAEFQDVETGRPDLLVRLAALDGSLEVRVALAGAPLAKHASTLIDQCIEAAIGIRRALGGVAGLFAGSIFPLNRAGRFDYLRDRPPRRNTVFPLSSVVDLIDLRFHESGHVASRPLDARALSATPPLGVTRTEVDGLVISRWAMSAAAAELARAASAHDAWAQQRIETERMPGWNDLGDQQEVKGTTQARPPLSLYGVKSKIGYKALMISPEGQIERTAWAEAKAVLDRGALDDGAPVKVVKLIVPLREQAIALAAEAQAAGFDAVLYPADNNTLWNPTPPGQWRQAPV